MAYNKNTWATGDIITAEKLNNMEDGIAAAQVLMLYENPDNGWLYYDESYTELFHQTYDEQTSSHESYEDAKAEALRLDDLFKRYAAVCIVTHHDVPSEEPQGEYYMANLWRINQFYLTYENDQLETRVGMVLVISGFEWILVNYIQSVA